VHDVNSVTKPTHIVPDLLHRTLGIHKQIPARHLDATYTAKAHCRHGAMQAATKPWLTRMLAAIRCLAEVREIKP